MHELEGYRWRVYAVWAVILACALLVVAKLFIYQVVQGDYYSELAQEEHWRKEETPAERGTIFDCNNNILATSVGYEALYAETSRMTDVDKAANLLAPVLNESVDSLRTKLAQKQTSPTLLKDCITYDVDQAIRKLDIDYVYLVSKPKRAYPEGSLAAQTLGVVGQDNQGLSGIEAYLEGELGGKPGSVLAERDSGGDAIALTIQEYVEPERGHDVVLTIDRYVQRVAEKELELGISNSNAKGGSVVVLEPRTGAVLALANRPSVNFQDADLFAEDKVALYRNSAVSDAYEPGSIFKIVTMATAIDSGAVTSDYAYYNSGSLSYAGGTVKNAVSRAPGPETMSQILERSSNIGAAHIAIKTGKDTFYRYVQNFGFSKATGIELPGESSGLMRKPGDSNWVDFDLATNSFGQGISVTPIQMASATAVVANGGTLMKPRLIKSVKGTDGIVEYPPITVRQVISPATAKIVTNMLVAAVDTTEGGVRASHLEGYRLAGKTGTAEIPDDSGYQAANVTNTSFAGFGPADDPKFVIVVKIIEPQSSSWAESVASPVFRDISKQLLDYYGIAPTE